MQFFLSEVPQEIVLKSPEKTTKSKNLNYSLMNLNVPEKIDAATEIALTHVDKPYRINVEHYMLEPIIDDVLKTPCDYDFSEVYSRFNPFDQDN